MNYFNVKKSKKTALALLFSVFFCVSAFAQQVSVKGTVTDPQGEPIIGAYVTLKGANGVGTVTDYDGNFTLKVPANGTLVFSYAGYKRQEVSIAGKSVVNVKLAEEAIGLDEVVAVGYGSQKAKEITSSVSSIKAEDLKGGVSNNPVGLLQGKVAGLNISKTSGGDPTNTDYNIQIRGFSTLDKGAGTSPLYIVDGIPVNNIDNISQEEIASMDVLKDGSAAAIYGTRGTNGVIIITTKRGATGNNDAQCGKTTVEYSGYISTSTVAGSTGMATADEYKSLSATTGGAATAVDHGYETDWVKALLRTTPITHNHNLAISGSAKDFSYRGSVSYKNSEGIAITSNREELMAKLAADQKALDGWLNLQYDFSYMNYRNDYFCGSFDNAAILNPTFPIYNADGSYFVPTGTVTSNPVADAYQKTSYKDGDFFRGSVKATVNVKPIKGLKLNGFGALEEGDNYKYWYNSVDYYDAANAGMAGRSTDRSKNTLFEGTADYVGQWGGHSLATVLGGSYQNFWYDGSSMQNGGFLTDDSKYYQLQNGDASKKDMTISSYRNSNTLISFFGRANYNYLEKYLLSASVRREGSSRFGANNKWGWFPAASAGWRISSEDFMKPITWINDLKIRFGYGVTGNNLASDLRSLELLSKAGVFGDSFRGEEIVYGVSQNANANLKWERKSEYNVGVDYSLLANRLSGSIDAYYRYTSDLLWDYTVPTPPYLYPTLLANAGTMSSKGLEIAITGVPVKTKDWTWSTTPTIAFNDNKILKLSDATLHFEYKETWGGGVGGNRLNGTTTQMIIAGESVGAFYGYKWTGQYTSTGNLVYEDKSGNGSIGKEDVQYLGSAQPSFTFGWNNTITYKNWDLTLFFRGVYGNKILNVARWEYAPSKGSNGLNVYWEQAEAIGNGEGTAFQTNFSDYYLEDGSYIKLDNATLGYNVPIKANKYVQKLRLYFTAQNVFTITSYSGMDPEVNTSSVWSPGIDDVSFYPSIRNFLFGVNLTL